MKKNIFNLIIVSSFFILFLEVLLNKTLVFNTISYSLNVWVNNLIPSMFPSFIISDILINYQMDNYIPKYVKKLFSKIFNVSEIIISIFFLSLLAGFPTSAKITNTLYEDNLITSKEANLALTFIHFANPIFVISTIGVLFLNNETYGYIILFSHHIGAIIIGIINGRIFSNKELDYKVHKKIITRKHNFNSIFINAVRNSIDTLLMILGTLTCFLIFSSLIINVLNTNDYFATIIKGVLEITMGLKELSILNIPDIYKIVISCMFISFGGISVHMQIMSIINNDIISYDVFLVSRIGHAIISGTICYLLYIILI